MFVENQLQSREDANSLGYTGIETDTSIKFTALKSVSLYVHCVPDTQVSWKVCRSYLQLYFSMIPRLGDSLTELFLLCDELLNMEVIDDAQDLPRLLADLDCTNDSVAHSIPHIGQMCKSLEILELNGHLPSLLLRIAQGRYTSSPYLKELRIISPYDFPIEFPRIHTPLQLSSLVKFTYDSEYSSAEDITNEVLRLVPNTCKTLIITGNTYTYVNDILRALGCGIPLAPNSLYQLESLEVHDSLLTSVLNITNDDLAASEIQYEVLEAFLRVNSHFCRLLIPPTMIPPFTLQAIEDNLNLNGMSKEELMDMTQRLMS